MNRFQRSVVSVYTKKQILSVVISISCFILMITNPQATLDGASLGIQQCIYVIIPSLLPYFFICTYLNSWLLGLQIPGIHHLARLLQIPAGGESILILGLIGGYPVGAQAISQTYHSGTISRRSAHILLGYCNNAGPAFIFGVTSCLFANAYIPWILWFIQFLAVLTTGWMLPHPSEITIKMSDVNRITVASALQKSIRNMASVCGWVIIFKIIITYLSSILSQLSTVQSILLKGILELSNGCISLSEVVLEPLRFLLCSILLSLGGICVLLQTCSVVNTLGLGYYIPGKILQTSLCILYSLIAAYIFFPDVSFPLHIVIITVLICLSIILFIFLYCRKK